MRAADEIVPEYSVEEFSRQNITKGKSAQPGNLYQATQDKTRAELEHVIYETYEQLLQKEQASAGWKEGA